MGGSSSRSPLADHGSDRIAIQPSARTKYRRLLVTQNSYRTIRMVQPSALLPNRVRDSHNPCEHLRPCLTPETKQLSLQFRTKKIIRPEAKFKIINSLRLSKTCKNKSGFLQASASAFVFQSQQYEHGDSHRPEPASMRF